MKHSIETQREWQGDKSKNISLTRYSKAVKTKATVSMIFDLSALESSVSNIKKAFDECDKALESALKNYITKQQSFDKAAKQHFS